MILNKIYNEIVNRPTHKEKKVMNKDLSMCNNDKRSSQLITPKSYMAFEEIKTASLPLMHGLKCVSTKTKGLHTIRIKNSLPCDLFFLTQHFNSSDIQNDHETKTISQNICSLHFYFHRLDDSHENHLKLLQTLHGERYSPIDYNNDTDTL